MPRKRRTPGFEVPPGRSVGELLRIAEENPDSVPPDDAAALASVRDGFAGFHDQIQLAIDQSAESSRASQSIIDGWSGLRITDWPDLSSPGQQALDVVSTEMQNTARVIAQIGPQVRAMGEIAQASLGELEQVRGELSQLRSTIADGQKAADRWAKALTFLTVVLVVVTVVTVLAPIIRGWLGI